MGKASLENMIRNDILNDLITFLSNKYDTDILPISASELAIPVLDAEGNERYAKVKVSIARGTRNGEGGYTAYDGYAAAEDWQMTLEDRKNKSDARKEKAERAEKERERKRAARATIKKLNKEGLDAMIHEEEGE